MAATAIPPASIKAPAKGMPVIRAASPLLELVPVDEADAPEADDEEPADEAEDDAADEELPVVEAAEPEDSVTVALPVGIELIVECSEIG